MKHLGVAERPCDALPDDRPSERHRRPPPRVSAASRSPLRAVAAAPEVAVVAAVLGGATVLGLVDGEPSAVTAAVIGLLVLVVVTAVLSRPPERPRPYRRPHRHPSDDASVTVPASSRWVR